MISQGKNSLKANASFSAADFAQALDNSTWEFRRGQVVQGKVHSYESEGVYVDIGGKSLAFLPYREISVNPISHPAEVLPLGEERDFAIVREQDAEGQVTLSIRELEVKRAWERIAEIQNGNQSLEVRVTGVNKGGITVDVEGLRGFIPRSHLMHRGNLEQLQGQNLMANFLEVDRDRNKLVLSQRQLAQSNRISQIQVGQLVAGEIVSIKPFGVFVDLDGVTGLLHINQISKNYVESLNSLFHLGQEIKAIVVNLEESTGRISLSTKIMENYPGEMLQNMAEVMASAEARSERQSQNIS
ncbi:MAG: 30S ribosomal protein S1 [Oscillatoriaceae cyanobacterium]